MPVSFLSDDLRFPPPQLAAKEGLLAVGGDLRPERLLLAYRMGIFPWYAADEPILWWSPDPRLLLYPAEVRVSRSLRRTLRKGAFEVTMDRAFAQVIEACARVRRPKGEGTWIVPEMIAAYIDLHREGHAHSVEVWQAGALAGGLYGVSLGRCFFGESMFSRVTDASKVALVHLAVQLARWDFAFIDCQVKTAHLVRLGARELPRRLFLAQLAKAVGRPGLQGKWSLDAAKPPTGDGCRPGGPAAASEQRTHDTGR